MHAILYGMRGVVDLPDKAAPHALSSKLEHAISMITSNFFFYKMSHFLPISDRDSI